MHADVKLENVLFCGMNRENLTGDDVPISEEAALDSPCIVLVDFGSACSPKDRPRQQYLQSRFYRAPEVVLGRPYSFPADIWSLGCMIPELLSSFPLFPGENAQTQLRLFIEALGPPPSSMLLGASTRAKRSALCPHQRFREAQPQTSNSCQLRVGSNTRHLSETLGCGCDVNATFREVLPRRDARGVIRPYPSAGARPVFSLLAGRGLSTVTANGDIDREIVLLVAFLERIIKWEPSERASVLELCDDAWFKWKDGVSRHQQERAVFKVAETSADIASKATTDALKRTTLPHELYDKCAATTLQACVRGWSARKKVKLADNVMTGFFLEMARAKLMVRIVFSTSTASLLTLLL